MAEKPVMIWDRITHEMIPRPDRINAFLSDIAAVCYKHKLSFAHDADGYMIVDIDYSELMFFGLADKNYTEPHKPI